MDHKELLKKCFEGHQPCVECDTVDGIDLISFGKEEDPYVLNFQIDGNNLSVNVIDKDRKQLIDNYVETFDSDEELEQKANDAAVAYNIILASKPAIDEKLESKEESSRRDEAVFHAREISSSCNSFVQKYDHDYSEDDVDFDKDLRSTIINIDDHRKSLASYLKISLYEDDNISDDGENTIEINSEDAGNNDNIESEDITDILNSASIQQLLEVATEKIRAYADSEEEEVVKRILEDIATQEDDIVDEISSLIE